MRTLSFTAALCFFVIAGIVSSLIEYFLKIYAEKPYLWPLIFGTLLVGAIIFYLWIDIKTKTVVKMKVLVDAFAAGDLTPKLYVGGEDELGELSEALYNMAGNLHRQIQQTIHEKDQMETILASMVEGVLAFDTTGRLMLVNKTAEEMLGIKWEQARGRFFLEFLQNYQLADLLKMGLSEGKIQAVEVRITPLDSEIYRAYITPIIGEQGKNQGAVMVLRNVTKMRLLEKMRSEFVANVSHELRTPLTSIKGYVETLLDGDYENKEISKKFLHIIDTQTDRLNRLISDLLYLSQLETGSKEIVKKNIDSALILSKAINVLQPVANEKNISLETYIHPAARKFNANQDMMEQVLINLLENAVKYSHVGGVVRVEVVSHESGIAIKVIDNGIGIPANSLGHLFERFYRVDKARTRDVGGTGLGLSIVKHIIDRHRGHVHVESVEDHGATFTVILPK